MSSHSPPTSTIATPASRDKPQSQCSKCKLPMEGQFVRALGGCYHLNCFQCRDCEKVVATRFFPMEEHGERFALCERDYFRRLDLLCANCGEALRGSYVTALSKKYHLEHFTCSKCPVVFGPNETYYEHGSQVFCNYHYSIDYASICGGCRLPILRQFVEVKSNQNEQWHPECYMIFKSWNIRMALSPEFNLKSLSADELKITQEVMDEKTTRIWNVLSAFEESAAACISDLLLHVSNHDYEAAVSEAGNFVMHVEALFSGIDNLLLEMSKNNDSLELGLNREPKMLCKKIVNFFSLLSQTQDASVQVYGTITQDLLALVTNLAQYLKIMIRVALAGALKLERQYQHVTVVGDFLNKLVELGEKQMDDESTTNPSGFLRRFRLNDADIHSDVCVSCKKSIEDSCVRFEINRWHIECFNCCISTENLAEKLNRACIDPVDLKIYSSSSNPPSGCKYGFMRVTQLEQYVFLLRVALKRLYDLLKHKAQQKQPIQAALPSHTEQVKDESKTEPTVVEHAITRKPPIPALVSTGGQSVHNLVEMVPQSSAESLNRTNTIAIPPPLQQPEASQDFVTKIGGWPMSPGEPLSLTPAAGKGRSLHLSEAGALERFIINHLTVLNLHPFVAKHYSLDQLIDLVKEHKASFWTKILASFKPGRKQAKSKESGTFGVNLESLVEKFGAESQNGNGLGRVRIPLFIDKAISSLRRLDLRVEGIFRKNGNIKKLNETQHRLDQRPDKIDLSNESNIQIAALLKKFFRELPEPLMTFKLYRLFILSQLASKDPETQKKILHYCICLLPKSNRDVLEVLLSFLRDVAEFADGERGNKMDLMNLATVFAPNILYSDQTKITSSVKDESFVAIDVVHMLLQYQDELWQVPDNISDIMASIELQDTLPGTVNTKDILRKYETVIQMKKNTESSSLHNSNSEFSSAARTVSPRQSTNSAYESKTATIISPN